MMRVSGHRGHAGESLVQAMRRLIIGSLTFLLVACNTNAPSEVKISLNSDKVLGVSDFEFEPAGKYSGCSVSGKIEYDIKIEPSNFTGVVNLDEVVVEYAGKWRAKPEPFYLPFVEGKIVEGGFQVSEYTFSEDPQDKKQAICASKSSSDIKLASLGTGLNALPGIKAAVVKKK